LRNPFIFGVGVMNLGAAIWYWTRGDHVFAVSLALGAVAACVQSFGSIS
jgi:hypothetical protein